ncbi:MAG: hypothetical protein WB683_03980 [Candidatus Sulfotelmatobacter sp.]
MDNESRPSKRKKALRTGPRSWRQSARVLGPRLTLPAKPPVHLAGTTNPNSKNALLMEKAYASYRRIYPAMKSIQN